MLRHLSGSGPFSPLRINDLPGLGDILAQFHEAPRSAWDGLRASVSGKGNLYDNASAETFFRSTKAELIWRRSWETRRHAETAVFQYINGLYNPRRRHSALGGKSRLAIERLVA